MQFDKSFQSMDIYKIILIAYSWILMKLKNEGEIME